IRRDCRTSSACEARTIAPGGASLSYARFLTGRSLARVRFRRERAERNLCAAVPRTWWDSADLNRWRRGPAVVTAWARAVLPKSGPAHHGSRLRDQGKFVFTRGAARVVEATNPPDRDRRPVSALRPRAGWEALRSDSVPRRHDRASASFASDIPAELR